MLIIILLIIIIILRDFYKIIINKIIINENHLTHLY